VGGMTITQTVEGRERYGVRLRLPQELRDEPELLADILVPTSGSATESATAAGGTSGMGTRGGNMPTGITQIPLGQVARVHQVSGPMAIKTEGAFPTAWVYVDVVGRDIGSYVADAKKMVDEMVTLPGGYRLQWSGQYEYMQRAKDKLMLVVPAVLLITFLLLYFTFKSAAEALIVMLALPFALVGGLVMMAALGYNWSVATAVGFIALAGVAAETGVVMLIYLDHAWDARRLQGKQSLRDLYEAVMEGTVDRVRPKMMTVTAIIAGLLPILWATGTGASVMKRIAAPMVGGMVGAVIDELIVLPAVYSLWKEWQLRRAGAASGEVAEATPTLPPAPYGASPQAG
jgi:Cu(I)/Ag(I) efflux system membrane protein CusA/SilA